VLTVYTRLKITIWSMIGGTMQKVWILGGLVSILLTLGLAPLPVPEQAETPSQVIAAVNAFRTAHDLPALEVDYALMGAAQAHSDYQASIGKSTHVGPDGSNPLDRAYAWGFGNGARAFVSENIAGGYKVTIEIAMLNPNVVYIGAGVATSGESTFYTLITGYYGSRPRPTSAPGVTPVPGETSAPGPTAVAYDPFIISTPREDGAIIHVVGYGQTLIGIANTYGVSLEELYAYNGYSEDEVIYPNEWVIIRPAGETSVTETPENPEVTSAPLKTEPPPRPTRTPRETKSTRPVVVVNPTATPTPSLASVSEGQEPVVVGIVILSLGVFVGVIFYGLLSRK
jgi:uncharacterized protein YkwD